ncbi:MAG: hypothetical protein ACTH32_06305 [Microbacterium gubbeenense]|uniref:hypothetical protein n=1 Tax=Microbacterium gubbeenense TaxID=159896 RepID=UPI003F9CC248
MGGNFRASFEAASKELTAKMEQWRDGIHAQVVSEMEDIAEGGAWEMQRIAESSVTPTGMKRAEMRGGHPGRIDSGNMVDAIEHRVEIHDTTIEAIWGWFSPDEYFLEQEHGTARIEAMESVQQSLDISEQDLIAKLDGLI